MTRCWGKVQRAAGGRGQNRAQLHLPLRFVGAADAVRSAGLPAERCRRGVTRLRDEHTRRPAPGGLDRRRGAWAGAATSYFPTVPQSLLDIRLLRIRTIRVSFLTGGGVDTITFVAAVFLLPLLFQEGFGMTAVQSGSLAFAVAVASLIVPVAMPRLLRHAQPARQRKALPTDGEFHSD
jgi:hypothetical protein